jgi:hypothetical protein
MSKSAVHGGCTDRKLALFPEACPLKAADRIANLNRTISDRRLDFAQMYLGEADEFKRALFGYDQPTHVPLAMLDLLDKCHEQVRQIGL